MERASGVTAKPCQKLCPQNDTATFQALSIRMMVHNQIKPLMRQIKIEMEPLSFDLKKKKDSIVRTIYSNILRWLPPENCLRWVHLESMSPTPGYRQDGSSCKYVLLFLLPLDLR